MAPATRGCGDQVESIVSAFDDDMADFVWPDLESTFGSAASATYRVNQYDLPGTSLTAILGEEALSHDDRAQGRRERITRSIIIATDTSYAGGGIASPKPGHLCILNAGDDDQVTYVVDTIERLSGTRCRLNCVRFATEERTARDRVFNR